MKHLIFIEGVSGVGKSTTSAILCEKLCALGYAAECFLEGDIAGPADLFWVAYLSKSEYEQLKLTYPIFADELSQNSISENTYVLTRYRTRQKELYSPELYAYLKAREFCCGSAHPAPLTAFTEVFANLWRRFSESKEAEKDYVVLDGSFLHHQINDVIRNYNASETQIVTHLTALLQTVALLNPLVFYFSSQNVGERLEKAFESRGHTAPTEEQIAFWESRKQTDLSVLALLPVEAHILDITHENWDSALDIILKRLLR